MTTFNITNVDCHKSPKKKKDLGGEAYSYCCQVMTFLTTLVTYIFKSNWRQIQQQDFERMLAFRRTLTPIHFNDEVM